MGGTPKLADGLLTALWGFGTWTCARRIYVGKDQETGLCKGFGFVSFEDRSDAEAALKKVHGLPYDHLILQVQWSVPKEQRPDADGPRRG